jgi:hypothetical protein
LVKTADLNTYRVSSTQHLGVTGVLVDCGANGGIAGCDCHVVKVNDQPQHFVNERAFMDMSWSGTALSWLALSLSPTEDPLSFS